MSDAPPDESTSEQEPAEFEELIDSLGDAIIVADEEGRILYANPAAADLLSLSPGEVKGERIDFTVGPGQLSEVELPTDGGATVAEIKAVHIRWRGTPAYALSLRDITPRRQTEKKLQEEERYRTLFHSTGDAILILDMDGYHLQANDVACSRLGYSRDQLMGMNIHQIDARHGPGEVKSRLEQIRRNGSLVFESVHRTRDGEEIPVEINSRLITYRGRSAVLNVARDISRRKEAERKKRRWRGFWHSTLDSLNAHIAVLDENADIIAVNSSWRVFADENGLEWDGYGVGRNYLKIAEKGAADGEETAETAARSIREMLARDRHFFELEYPCHGPETERWFLMRGTRFRSEGAIRVVVAHEDVTGRRQAEKQLRDAYEQLRETRRQVVDQERQRALSQMASGIAHDFNNALSPIRGYAELLLQNPKKLNDTPTVKRYLQDIKKAADQAAETVRRMRKFYRPAEEWEHEPVDINSVVEEAVSMTRPRWKQEAQAEGITIGMETHLNSVPPVKGNENELHEMLTNLIFNAVDAMEGDGRIRAATSAERQEVVIEVSDTGPGMDEETLQHCMDPFYTTKAETGTGLGLSVTQGIARRHGGEVEVESELGKGTTFRILLPPAEETAETPSANGDEDPEEGLGSERNLSLLVVEDDQTQQELMNAILESAGHTVDTAPDGTKGLQKFSEGYYDAVLTDRAMPRVGGDELARMIKDSAPDKPVIMLTGFGDMMEASGEKPEHVDAVISKPVSEDKLRRVLSRVLEENAADGKRPETAGPDPASPSSLESLLHTLHKHLRANQIEAGELTPTVVEALEGSSCESLVQELEECVEQFDFAKARALLQKIAQQMDITLEDKAT